MTPDRESRDFLSIYRFPSIKPPTRGPPIHRRRALGRTGHEGGASAVSATLGTHSPERTPPTAIPCRSPQSHAMCTVVPPGRCIVLGVASHAPGVNQPSRRQTFVS